MSICIHFSDEDNQILKVKLWDLLKIQTRKYTMGDSTSVTIETAEELLSSLWYTLTVTVEGLGIPYDRLLTDELYPLIKQGQDILNKKVEKAKYLCNIAYNTMPKVKNGFYTDTINGIIHYLKHYDLYNFAHRRPEDICYPLIENPSESLLGVSYAEEYLKCMIRENMILSRFDDKLVESLLESTVASCENDYFNLCEQPITNVIGRALIKKSIKPLNIAEEERYKILTILKDKDKEEINKLLCDALNYTCTELNMNDDLTKSYLLKLIEELLPRLEAAVQTGDLSKIFITIIPDGDNKVIIM